MNGKKIVDTSRAVVGTGIDAVGDSLRFAGSGGKTVVDWVRKRTPVMFSRTTPLVAGPPGVVEGAPAAEPARVHVMSYGPDDLVEHEGIDIGRLGETIGALPVTWVDVVGLGEPQVIKDLGGLFDLHPLVVEDIAHAGQRAKSESFGSHIFVVAREVVLSPEFDLSSEQVSIVIGPDYLLTVHERSGGCFDPIRERIRTKAGRIRSHGADYLTYVILDTIVDSYFPILEQYREQIELLEDQVVMHPAKETVAGIYGIKRDLLAIRRAVWPLREVVSSLVREEHPLIQDGTRRFLHDAYDHAVRAVDIVEIYRELASGLMDTYLSSMSHQTNEVMRVLTIIATVFIPLTFIAGVYGMNFNTEASPLNMPELAWYWGYPAFWGAILVVLVAMVVYFRRKRWL